MPRRTLCECCGLPRADSGGSSQASGGGSHRRPQWRLTEQRDHEEHPQQSVLHQALRGRTQGHRAQTPRPFDLLTETYRLYEDHRQASGTYHRQRAPQTHRAALPGRYGGSKLRSCLTDSLARAMRARGSSKAVMVELRELEPLNPLLPIRF